MDFMLEVGTFLLGSLVWAFKGAIGKALLKVVIVLLKIFGRWFLRMSEHELKVYHEQRLASKQSALSRTQKQ